jgi:ubiquinone/menaquinone biosynthesis C-methylase UbiE
MGANPYDAIYHAIAESITYKDVLRLAVPSLPEWIVPLSVTSLDDLKELAGLSELRSGQRFADLACGLGGVALWIADKTGASCTGVDFSSVAVAKAMELAERRNFDGRANFVTADMTQTRLPSQSFDAIFSIDALQFVDPDAAANEIARLLAPQGIAVIRTWEAVSDDLPRPTMVNDYEPVFEKHELHLVSRSVLDDRNEWLRFFRAVNDRANDFRKEVGASIEPILQEAAEMLRCSGEPARTRHVILKVRRLPA